MTEPTRDPEVEGFLAVSAARLAPRTVEAYGRDLAALGTWLGRSPATAPGRPRALPCGAARRGTCARDARPPARRRALAVPPQLLIGPRDDNPAAEIGLPVAAGGCRGPSRREKPSASWRQPRKPPPARSATARSSSYSYGAGLRVSELSASSEAASTSTAARAHGRQGRQGTRRPVGRSAADALRRYWREGGRSSTAATGPSCS